MTANSHQRQPFQEMSYQISEVLTQLAENAVERERVRKDLTEWTEDDPVGYSGMLLYRLM